jgi:hypothetical protein
MWGILPGWLVARVREPRATLLPIKKNNNNIIIISVFLSLMLVKITLLGQKARGM